MPNYTKKNHRIFRKKIGGVKKNKERTHSQRQSQFYTNWRPEFGQPGSIAVDYTAYQQPRQPYLDPETSLADDFKRFYRNNISKNRIITGLRSLSRLFNGSPTPTPTPTPTPIPIPTPRLTSLVETPMPRRSTRKKIIKIKT